MVPFSKRFLVEESHLFLPVKNGAEKVVFQILAGEKTVREFDIELAPGETPDWWAFYDVSQFLGQQIELKIPEDCLPATTADWLGQVIDIGAGLRQAEDLYHERWRPQFHFTSRRGWNNDPNGLVYQAGAWHMFYQLNPFGIQWGNMHWGHAVSHDLVHWTELPIALYQKSLSDMAFSGGAVIDNENSAGFSREGQAPLVLSFTSTGRGECLAYSLDEGVSFQEYAGNPIIQHTGRDPKVFPNPFYGKALLSSGGQGQPAKWVMIVYEELDEVRGYALYGSNDLKSWQNSCFLPGYYECPELFELPVDGSPGERYWVVYGCVWEKERSVFTLGRFDGQAFIPLTEPRAAHAGPHFYAAQTFSHAPGDRKIMLGWLAGAQYPGMPFSQGMTVPLELSLRRFSDGLYLCFNPVRELEALRRGGFQADDLTPAQANEMLLAWQNSNPEQESSWTEELLDIYLQLEPLGAGEIRFTIFNQVLEIDLERQEVRFAGSRARLPESGGILDFRILVDRSVIEIFAFGGSVAFAWGGAPPEGWYLTGGWKLELVGNMSVKVLELHPLKSIWIVGTHIM